MQLCRCGRRGRRGCLLTVDIPPEEVDAVNTELQRVGMDNIFLVAPTTPAERMAQIAAQASGFIYYVSLKGVTGAGHLDTRKRGESLASASTLNCRWRWVSASRMQPPRERVAGSRRRGGRQRPGCSYGQAIASGGDQAAAIDAAGTVARDSSGDRQHRFLVEPRRVYNATFIGVGETMSWIDKILPSGVRSEESGKRSSSVLKGCGRSALNAMRCCICPDVERNHDVCPKCDHHMRIGARSAWPDFWMKTDMRKF